MFSAGNITGLRCEHLSNPLGIETLHPRLSWWVEEAPDSSWQEAYQIQVASTPDLIRAGQPDIWNSGKVESRQSVLVEYDGRALSSGKRLYWRVRIWNENDRPLPWSKIAFWEMGLLEPTDWKASWIGRKNPDPAASPPCLFLRKSFVVEKPVARARLYMTARGVFEPWLNGERIRQDYFSPGWTEYADRIEYVVYDISKRLVEGENVIGAILGDGWYCGTLLFQNQRGHYGDEASLCGMVVIEYDDASNEIIPTEESWKLGQGPILASDIYHGEFYDARRELDGWSHPSWNDTPWDFVEVLTPYEGKLVGKTAPPVQVVDELIPVSVTGLSPGLWIVDLGQNMVGQYRLAVRGAAAGQRITLRFGEMLQEDGSLYTANLRQARATDIYLCKGSGEEHYQPKFTFHGYRYVEVSGYPGVLIKGHFVGLVLHSKLEPTGTFECSDPLVNQLQSNIVWGQKGNFLDIPTDCPQRDERLGWTGDAQVFVTTSTFNFNVAAFFSRWLKDMALAQLEDGAITDVVPSALLASRQMDKADRERCRAQQGNAAWADAAVICPWVIYQRYGDRRVLGESWEMMTRWIEFQRSTSNNLIRPQTSYGDWLAIGAEEPGAAPTPCELIGTAYFAYTSNLVGRIATLLGKPEEAANFLRLHADVVEAFNREYVDQDGLIQGDTQTAYLLALAFDLLPKEKQGFAVERLVQLIEATDDHLSTGFVGTPLLCPVLSRYGRTDVAYRLLMQKSYPGWLYTVLNGATTMWERWNSWTREGGFGDAAMNSFNHYAYGAIGQWLYATVAGIEMDPEFPGFERFLIQPRPGGDLTFAKAELKTPHGWVKSHWRLEENIFHLDVSVPPNTSAKVILPSACFYDALVNDDPLEETHHVIYLRLGESTVGFTLRSGTFNISIPMPDSNRVG